VDLFEPGSGSQVHDNNGGILASGLFWTVPLDDDAISISRDGRRLVLRARDVPVIDSFQFFGPNQIPASVSFRVEWRAMGEFVERGSGTNVPPTDPAAFLGRFAVARSTATFQGSEFGFGLRSDPGVSTDGGFAELGRERNGVFLS
jgi:hypothetical protein